MKIHLPPQRIINKDILPAHLGLPPEQNISMHPAARHTAPTAPHAPKAPPLPTKTRRPPLPRRASLQLQPAPHRLRDPVLAPQHVHLGRFRLGAPLREARLQRVRGLALRVGGVGHGAGARFWWNRVGEGEALAEGVGDAGGGGGGGCLVG